MKGPGTRSQSSELSQKYVDNVCHDLHYSLAKFHFDTSNYSKRKSKLLIFTDVFDDVIDFEISEFKKNAKTEISSDSKHYFSFK